ncbi:hypothetical protein ACFSZS_17555 [Seohaeicola zhoushanensis]
MNSETQTRLRHAVDDLFERQTEFLSELVAFPSTRGQEQAAQDFMARAFEERGLATDHWTIDIDDIRGCRASRR